MGFREEDGYQRRVFLLIEGVRWHPELSTVDGPSLLKFLDYVEHFHYVVRRSY